MNQKDELIGNILNGKEQNWSLVVGEKDFAAFKM